MENSVSQSDVDQYELLKPLLVAAYKEMQELSKKKPDSALNAYKVKMVNRILIPSKELFKSEPSYNFLDTLNSDDLPTNSDVVIILGQYLKALDMFHSRYYAIFTRRK